MQVMDCVDALVEAGADLNLYNEKNKTSPIELAFKMRSLRMVKALVRHGVDVKKGNPNIQRAMENEADFREGVDYIRHVHIFRYVLFQLQSLIFTEFLLASATYLCFSLGLKL